VSVLVPCPDCARHMRRIEERCPFCGSDVSARIAAIPERTLPTVRLGRSALFAFAAATVGVASCGGTAIDRTGDTGGASTGGGIGLPLYGGGPFLTGGNPGAGGELGVPLYGGPFFTGGSPGAGGVPGSGGLMPDTGGFMALYGAGGILEQPPPDAGPDVGRDAGHDAGGSVVDAKATDGA